jgi:ABC-type glutathione transport system ATPase component
MHVCSGPNGSGKSLLLKSIVGRLPKPAQITEGDVLISRAGSYEDMRLYRFHSIVYVPQHCTRLLSGTSPWAVLLSILSILPHRPLRHSKELLLEGVLWHGRPGDEGSVGQVRFATCFLAALAALVRPEVEWLIADEPDAYLDAVHHEALAIVFATVAAMGKGLLVTSHHKELYAYAKELNIPASVGGIRS